MKNNRVSTLAVWMLRFGFMLASVLLVWTILPIFGYATNRHDGLTSARPAEAANECDRASELGDVDPNETASTLKIYCRVVQLRKQGKVNEAKLLLEASIAQYPESRHLHQQYAEVAFSLAEENGAASIYQQLAATEAVRAFRIGLGYSKIGDTWLLGQTLGKAGNQKEMDELFARVLALSPSFTVYLEYAQGLELLKDVRAEKMYLAAIQSQPQDNFDATTYFGEWLLGQGRAQDALQILPPNAPVKYVNFLRGIAFEKLGQLDVAKNEYSKFSEFSQYVPAPSRFQIVGSEAQRGISFASALSDEPVPGNDADVEAGGVVRAKRARYGLATLIWGEARGENAGGMRAAGWVVRNRVLRGSVPSASGNGTFCPSVSYQGATTLPDKYWRVMCQTSQFDGICSAWCGDPNNTPASCTTTPTIRQVAYDIWVGAAPDPTSGYCGGGYILSTCQGTCNPCSGTVYCYGNMNGYNNNGAMFNIGVGSIDESSCPGSAGGCTTQTPHMYCNDGVAPNNCFYRVP